MTAALLGGALIGLGAAIFWFATARPAGVSGLLRDALRSRGPERNASVAFVIGLLAVGAGFHARAGAVAPRVSVAVLALAGLLVGFGARVGGGCTSGHGVCGVSRLSRRSMTATGVFMVTGALTVFAVRHGLHLQGGVP